MTRTLARQISGPVPSPSMKGTIGLSGTTRRPLLMDILAPSAGAVNFAAMAVDMLYSARNVAWRLSADGANASTRYPSGGWLEYASMTRTLQTTPAADGFRMPAEFE